MKSFIILLSILISLTKGNNLISSLLSLSNYEIHYDPEKEKNEETNLRGELFKILRDDVESRNVSNSGITKSCLNVINRLLLGHFDDKNPANISYIISDYHIVKALDDSSKNRNNLGTYDQCMYKSYKFMDILNKTDTRYSSEYKTYSTYIVLALDRNYSENAKILELDYDFILHGFCFPQGYIIDKENGDKGEYCTDEDYLKLLKYYNNQYNNLFLLNNATIKVFTLRQNPHESETTSTFCVIINSLPLVYFGIQSLFVITVFIVKLIKVRNNNKIRDEIKDNILNEERNSDARDKFLVDVDDVDDNEDNNNIKLKEFFDCFIFEDNFNELFNFSINSTKYNNDSGLNYIRGLIGISIVFVLVGFAFVVMYNAPTKVSSPNQLNNLFTEDWLFNLCIIIGIRYSPRIILSCSGYLLAFKYVSYLDKNFIRNTESILKSSLKFISYQIHKYFLLIMILLAERYSVYHLYNLFKSESPMFKYFNINILKKPDETLRFLLSFTLIGYFFHYEDEQYRKGQHLLLYFWLPFNEIIFFLLGIIIISFGFKYQWRIDILILILTPIIYFVKIFYSYLIESYYQVGDYPLKKWYASLYYVFFNYGRDMINPIFNLPYYLIGMYFGFVNYTIQKGINSIYKESKDKSTSNAEIEGLLTKKDEESVDDYSEDNLTNDNSEDINIKKGQLYCDEIEKMHFLIIPVKFVLWNRKNANFKNRKVFVVIGIISVFLIFFLISFHLIKILFYSDYNETFKDPVFNLIYRIDIELVVVFIHWLLFIIMINSANFLLDIFNHIIWIILSRPYFSFILIVNSLFLFIFYHEETLIEINAITILMYSLIGGGFTFFFMSLFYVFFELPLKRMIRLFYKWHSDSKEQKENEKDKMKQKNDDDSDNDEENNSEDNDKIKNE